MKKTISILSVLALGACVYGTPVNNEGLYTEMDLTTVDWTAVNKHGRACQTNLFGVIPFGDKSVPTAVRNGKIQYLSYVDTDSVMYFPLILSKECTNAWGIGYSTPVISTPAQIAPATKADTKTTAKTTAKKK